MNKIFKRITAMACAMVMAASMAMGASAASISATLETRNNVNYTKTISARNTTFSVEKCKNGDTTYSKKLIPSHSHVAYAIKGTSTSNIVSLSKTNDTQKKYYLYTEIQTYNSNTKRTVSKNSSITTKNAGCGISINRNAGNKALRYTLSVTVKPSGDFDAMVARNLWLIVKQK